MMSRLKSLKTTYTLQKCQLITESYTFSPSPKPQPVDNKHLESFIKQVSLFIRMQQQVKDWWDQAQADLKTARDLIVAKNYYASVNYSQQSAEKSLKAVYLLIHKKIPPKIHDLVELARLVHTPEAVILQAGKLTITYFSSRYPGTAPEIPAKYYDQEKARRHLQEAEVIIQWAQEKIE